MQKKKITFLYFTIIVSLIITSCVAPRINSRYVSIYSRAVELRNGELKNYLRNQIQQNQSTNWDQAKRYVYNQLNKNRNTIKCIYSSIKVQMSKVNGVYEPNNDVNVDIEHAWSVNASWAKDHFTRPSIRGCDLHHLYPALAGLNRSRGNRPYGVVVTNGRMLWVLPNGRLGSEGNGTNSGSKFGKKNGKSVFEPRQDHRGDLARAIFYMSTVYNMPIPIDMESDLKQWNKDDPVDSEERDRMEIIEGIQGNRNPFIDNPSLVDKIDDF